MKRIEDPNHIIYWDIFNKTWYKINDRVWDSLNEETLKEIFIQVYGITREISHQIKTDLTKPRK